MKTNSLHFVSHWFESLVIAIAIVLILAGDTAKAQDGLASVNDFVLNGLFTPTAAQRFFETGRENFARETRILEDPERYFDGDILTIAPEAIREMQQNQSPSGLWQNHPNHKLDLDMYLDTE